jgi:hypothetical protein
MKICTVILLGGVLAVFVWLLDIRGLETLLHQHAAESFPHVPGEVLSSQVTITHGSKGSIHYHVAINYRYGVDGTEFAGWRYRYDGHPTDSASANSIVQAHPRGSAVDVYYNPRDPRDAVLSPGVDARDVSLLFIFTPLNLLFLWLLIQAIGQLDRDNLVAGGVRVIPDMMATRVRLPRYSPWLPGFIAAGALSLLAGILIATGELHPPWDAGGWCLPVVLLGGGAAYLWLYLKVQSGRQDLVINEASRTIQLPLTYKRREQPPISFSQITAVVLDKVRHKNRNRVYYSYVVMLQMQDGSPEKLLETTEKRAESLAAWLKEKFGLRGETFILNPEGL